MITKRLAILSLEIVVLSLLSVLAIVAHAWSGPDESMIAAANRVTTKKTDENKGLVQEKKKPTPKPVQSTKKRNNKPQSGLPCPQDGAVSSSIKRDVDFLKAVEEKRRVRWIDFDQNHHSPESLRRACNNKFFTSQEAPATESSNTDFGQSLSKPFPAGSKDFEVGTQLEILRHLESKKGEILRQIFMGFRFSFPPTSRHVVLEMGVTPSNEKGPGLIIPF